MSNIWKQKFRFLLYLAAFGAIATYFQSVSVQLGSVDEAVRYSIAREAAVVLQLEGLTSSFASSDGDDNDNNDIADSDLNGSSTPVEAFQYYLSSGEALLEDIQNLDPTVPPPECGYYKCYVHSQHFPEYGYTIANPMKSANTYTKDMMDETYAFVKRLEVTHGINHYYHPDVPPQLIPPSNSLLQYLRGEMKRAKYLNLIYESNRTGDETDANISDVVTLMHKHNITAIPKPTRGGRRDQSPTYRTIGFKNDRPYLVQVMLTMPADTYVLTMRKKRYNRRQVQRTLEWVQILTKRWQDNNNISSSNNNIDVTNDTMSYSFCNNFRHYVNQTITLLDDEPYLIDDFQVAFQPDGSIWHFDLDRAIGNNTRGKKAPIELRRANVARIQRFLRCLEGHVLEYVSAGPTRNVTFSDRKC